MLVFKVSGLSLFDVLSSFLKNHPYIIASVFATLLSIVVWALMPKEYAAVTKVSDEYKEVDLAVGLNRISARINDALGSADKGINDLNVYSKILRTEDFTRAISHKKIPCKDITYGDWIMQNRHFWQSNDTIELIADNIEYNVNGRQSTLTVQFTDSDPLVAYEMLDLCMEHLQEIVTASRNKVSQAAMQNAERERNSAAEEYRKAQHRYNVCAESNQDTKLLKHEQDMKYLQTEMELAYRHYKEVTQQYIRQLYLKQRAYCSFAVVKANTVPIEDTRNFALLFFAVISLSLLFAKAFVLYGTRKFTIDYGDFFSPWSLTIFIWGADIILYFLQGELYPLGPMFIKCFTLWIITIIPASLISYWLSANESNPVWDKYNVINVSKSVFNVCCVFATIITLLYIKRVWDIVSQFDTVDLLYNVRTYLVHDNSGIGLLYHIQGLNFALFVVGIWLYPKISKLQLAYIFILNIAFEIARMEKSGILIMILGILYVLYVRKVIKVRSIFVTLLGTIVLFYFFNMSKEKSDTTNVTSFIDFFGIYVTSPIVAFDYLHPDLSGNFGENTFNIIYPYLNMLGCNFQYTDRLQEFVFVPVITNVYTIMQPFYNDFGVIGIPYFGIMYGALFGWVYRRSREGNPVYICIYTYLVEVILIQFYNENLLQNIILFIEFAVCVVMLTGRYRLSFAKVK